MEKLFAPADLRAMHRVRQAFDPAGRLNPGKKFTGRLAAVQPRVRGDNSQSSHHVPPLNPLLERIDRSAAETIEPGDVGPGD